MIPEIWKAVSVTKMLILYAKFLPSNAVIYKTVFLGILQLPTCNSTAAIKELCAMNYIDIEKMVMLTGYIIHYRRGYTSILILQTYSIISDTNMQALTLLIKRAH